MALVLPLLSLCLVLSKRRWRPASLAADSCKEIREAGSMHSSSGAVLTVTDAPPGEAEEALAQFRERQSPEAEEERPQGARQGSPIYVCEFPHYGWGYWFTLRDLGVATQGFSEQNVLGEGGYGTVYRGRLANGVTIAVKSLSNDAGQAERGFTLEVEAIGRVRHKNLVRLLGYCVEGTCRMLVYEYIDNGNLDQWLHGQLGKMNPLPWDARMKIVIGVAKGLAYLHEALEPKVVHRDVKASNVLVDKRWNAKVSDFGLAKMLGRGKSHATTRVMGTPGYVAPEYADTGLLNEGCDVYSFGVLLLEVVSGRDPIDYDRPHGEVNLTDWSERMVGDKRGEEVVDPSLPIRPTPLELERALMVAFLCVDPRPTRRPPMGHVVPLLEVPDFFVRYRTLKQSGDVGSGAKCSEDRRSEGEQGFPPCSSETPAEKPKENESDDDGKDDPGWRNVDHNGGKLEKKHCDRRSEASATTPSRSETERRKPRAAPTASAFRSNADKRNRDGQGFPPRSSEMSVEKSEENKRGDGGKGDRGRRDADHNGGEPEKKHFDTRSEAPATTSLRPRIERRRPKAAPTSSALGKLGTRQIKPWV